MSLLDERDISALDSLMEDATRGTGFFSIVGSPEFFDSAIEELQRKFRDNGMPAGEVIAMPAMDTYDVDELVGDLPPVIYFTGFAEPSVWEKIKIRRSIFLASNVIVIFFLNTSQFRMLADRYASIASLITNTNYPLGGQRTLDNMGEAFQNRLYGVLSRIDAYERKLDDLLQQVPPASPPGFLLVLRRWNSFSPIMGSRPVLSSEDALESVWRQLRREIRGGGYFLRWDNFGIAIDPGHNFIENLYRTDHSISEIDAVVITHDHLDHTSDFEALLDLLYQYNKRGGNKQISVYLNPTTYDKYERSLIHNDAVRRVEQLALDPRRFYFISRSNGIRLHSMLAKHTELGGAEKAVSLRFHLSAEKGAKKVSVGFTADTGWHQDLKSFFKDVDVLVPHVGSIKRYELENAKFYETHLGILGVFKILWEIHESGGTPTVVISEFGEELMGLRDSLGEELARCFPGMKIFPADIGHLVELNPGSIRIMCGKNCSNAARSFFEHDGEIQLRCREHKPTMGAID
ncbi:MAG: hypothetical protein GY765_35830 [bacterium]|nr:hypothetical protein [bacterium]